MLRPVQEGAQGCAAIGAALHEPAAGSALKHKRFLLLEDSSIWDHDAQKDRFPLLAQRCDRLGIRLQLIRRELTAELSPQRTAILVWADGLDRRAEQLSVTGCADPLDELDLERFADEPNARGFGAEIEGPVLLVCTHGRKDPCCAERGRPMLAALRAAGADAWHTTHLGGDRFAANVFAVPAGVMLGRAPAATARELLAELQQGEAPPELMRGRVGYAPHVQAAEVAFRRANDIRSLTAVEPTSVEQSSDGRWTVGLRHEDAAHSVVVRHVTTGVLRPTSCRNEELKDPGQWEVVEIR